jgi:SAM-dependent methyltransferase
MVDPKIDDVQASYDRVADEYVRRVYDELLHKPLDRQLLDRFAHKVWDAGLVCDLGLRARTGSSLFTRARNSCVWGRLSPGMVERARQLNPGIEFRRGDMRELDVLDEAWAGIAAFYAIVNLAPADVAQAMREMERVLRPGRLLLLSFHIGDETLHIEDLWGCTVCLDYYFFRTEDVAGALRNAGFDIDEVIERKPYAPEVEYQSRRAYILARKPSRKTTTA